MDKTYIKVAGQWKYLYRAADKTANTAAIESVKAEACNILMRQKKYLNNIVEQDHQGVKKSRNRCLDSSRFGVLESLSQASRPCT